MDFITRVQYKSSEKFDELMDMYKIDLKKQIECAAEEGYRKLEVNMRSVECTKEEKILFSHPIFLEELKKKFPDFTLIIDKRNTFLNDLFGPAKYLVIKW